MRKKEFLAVDHVSLYAKEGEIVGILGPNGAGKTTLLRMLGMLMTPTQGELALTDASGNAITEHTKKKAAIGYLSNNTKLYQRFSIREHLKFLGKLYDYTEQEISEIAIIENPSCATIQSSLTLEIAVIEYNCTSSYKT